MKVDNSEFYQLVSVAPPGSKDKTWDKKIASCPKEFEPGQFKTQTCFDGRFGEERGSDQFGVQIMMHSGTPDSRVAKGFFHYVEVRHAGQAFRLGRYPIHFHMDGDVRGSYVKGCAIHHSFNRAVTMHGIHNLVVQDTVIYDILGKYLVTKLLQEYLCLVVAGMLHCP